MNTKNINQLHLRAKSKFRSKVKYKMMQKKCSQIWWRKRNLFSKFLRRQRKWEKQRNWIPYKKTSKTKKIMMKKWKIKSHIRKRIKNKRNIKKIAWKTLTPKSHHLFVQRSLLREISSIFQLLKNKWWAYEKKTNKAWCKCRV